MKKFIAMLALTLAAFGGAACAQTAPASAAAPAAATTAPLPPSVGRAWQ